MTQGTKKWSVKFCCALSGTNTHTNNNNNEAKFITRGMPSICTVIIVIFFFFIHSLIFFHFCKLAIKVSNLINHVTKQREYSYGMEEAFVRYRYNDLDTHKKMRKKLFPLDCLLPKLFLIDCTLAAFNVRS